MGSHREWWPFGRKQPLEGSVAREMAEEELQRTRERGLEIRKVSDSLRALQRDNHFAEKIEYLIRGGIG